MQLKTLINKSWYGSIGYIKSVHTLEDLARYLLYNEQVLKEYQGIVVAYNCADDVDASVKQDVETLWTSFFKEKPVTVLFNSVNRGPNFGYCDLDDMIFEFCKQSSIKWLCKSADDMILMPQILDLEVDDDCDFYYTTSVGYSALYEPYKVTVEKVYDTDEYFYPQTNFYFIDVEKVDYLNDKDHVNEIYNHVQNIEGYNGKAWEYGFRGCEVLLKESVERSNLKAANLITREVFAQLLVLIRNYKIVDPSHKQIMIQGICHMPDLNEQIISI